MMVKRFDHYEGEPILLDNKGGHYRPNGAKIQVGRFKPSFCPFPFSPTIHLEQIASLVWLPGSHDLGS